MCKGMPVTTTVIEATFWLEGPPFWIRLHEKGSSRCNKHGFVQRLSGVLGRYGWSLRMIPVRSKVDKTEGNYDCLKDCDQATMAR